MELQGTPQEVPRSFQGAPKSFQGAPKSFQVAPQKTLKELLRGSKDQGRLPFTPLATPKDMFAEVTIASLEPLQNRKLQLVSFVFVVFEKVFQLCM